MGSLPKRSPRTRWAPALSLALGVSLCVAGPSLLAGGELAAVAHAQEKPAAPKKVNAELIVLHATNDGKGIDPSIGSMPQLKKPPFSAYDTYKLLSKSELALEMGKAKTESLPNSQDLSVVYKEKKGQRYVLNAVVKKGSSNTLEVSVMAKSNEVFFVAGPKHGSGILVIGIKVKP